MSLPETPPLAVDAARLRDYHISNGEDCVRCLEPHPCDAIRLLDALEAAQRTRDGFASTVALLASMRELLTEADDLCVELVNWRVPDPEAPFGRRNPLPAAWQVRADRLITGIRKRPELEAYAEQVRARDEAIRAAERVISSLEPLGAARTATASRFAVALMELRAALDRLHGRGGGA